MACNTCGKSKKKNLNGDGKLVQRRESVSYVRARLSLCALCEHNVEGTCDEQKKIKPDSDCDIVVGTSMAKSYCPVGKWGRHVSHDYPAKTKCSLCSGYWNADNEICPSCVNKLENKRKNLDKGIGRSHRVAGGSGTGRVNAITRDMLNAVRNTPNRKRNRSAFSALYEKGSFLTVNDLANDAFKLSSMLPHDVEAIVGVARSGITPANICATLLHKPLIAVRQTRNDVIDVGNGWRMGADKHVSIDRKRKVAVVDDTCMTGNSLRAIEPLLKKEFPNHVTASVYVNPLASKKPDLWVHDLAWPHILEWNLFNSVLSPNCATDFDGVLCYDCAGWQDDDGNKYVEFMKNAIPKYMSRRSVIPLIVTARIEKYRAVTEDWLRKHGIRWGKLVMHPAKSLAERRKDDIAAFKAKHYKAWAHGHVARPKPIMFIESEPLQAKRIAELSGLVVTCPSNTTVYGDVRQT